MTNNQVADRFVILRTQVEAQEDHENEQVAARLHLADFVMLYESQIVHALQKRKI